MFELPPMIITAVILAASLFVSGWVYSKIRDFKQSWAKEIDLRNFKNTSMTDGMDDYQFEHFVAFLYRNKGYKAEVTPKGNDKGIDIIMEKEGKKVWVQVKHYKVSNKIGRVELQRFVGSYNHIADRGYFVTSSLFNKNAVEYAKDVPSLTLVNRADLGDMIEGVPDGWQKRFLLPNNNL